MRLDDRDDEEQENDEVTGWEGLQPGKAVEDDCPGRNEVQVESVSGGLPMPDVRDQTGGLIGLPKPLCQRLPSRMTADAGSNRGRSRRPGPQVRGLESFSKIGIGPRRERGGRKLSAPRGCKKKTSRGRANPAKVVLQHVNREKPKTWNRLRYVGVDSVPFQDVLVDVNL